MLWSNIIVSLFGLGTALPTADDGSHKLGANAETTIASSSSTRVAERAPAPWPTLLAPYREAPFAQVRIERRIILRVTPRPAPRRSLVAPASTVRLVRRDTDQCVPLASIAGFRAQDTRLLFYLRDRRLLSADLDRACSPREFYAGFYLERPEDGRLCVNRDDLHARSGAKCSIAQFSQLVAEER